MIEKALAVAVPLTVVAVGATWIYSHLRMMRHREAMIEAMIERRGLRGARPENAPTEPAKAS